MDTAVALVEGYLRLNGYFTVTEFQVQHPRRGHGEEYETATDLDVLAVRLPWAAEAVSAAGTPSPHDIVLTEDPALRPAADRPDILIAEVKEGAGRLNRALLTPEVLHAALHRVGCCPEEHIADAAAALRTGEVRLDPPRAVVCRIRVASFCGFVDEDHPPHALTITLDHVLRFIQDRLTAYRAILRSAHFTEHTLGLLKLLDKLGLQIGPGKSGPQREG